MKRIFMTGLLAISIASLLLNACSKAPNDTAPQEENKSGTQTSAVSPPGQFPIVGDKAELTILVAGNGSVKDFATNSFTQWYEEKTNVHINWEVAPEGSTAEALNLRLSSGDYPDIFMNMGVTREQEMIYGKQGVFLPLNDLIDKNSFYMNDMFEARPYIKETITAPDGNIYSIPEVNECYHCSMSMKMWMYDPWLKKLGLEVPTTTDEFYQVLKAFKEKDPNGNGKADEIPLAGSQQAWNGDIAGFLMNAFVYAPPERMYIEDGKIKASFDQEGWKEGLEYLHKLYADGLLSGVSFTQDGQQLVQMGENPDVPILGAAPGGYVGVLTQVQGESGRWLDYKSIAPLEGPGGLKQSAYFPYQVNTGKFVVTNAVKNPDIAIRWVDGLFEEEVRRRMDLGVPGKQWREAEEGELGADGRPAKITRIPSSDASVKNDSWSQSGPTWLSDDYRLTQGIPNNGLVDNEALLYQETKKNYEPYHVDIGMVVPPLFFSGEQSSELADLSSTITDYVNEMVARFVTGDADIEKEWDSYLSTLDSMNLKRYLEIYQEAYDAKK